MRKSVLLIAFVLMGTMSMAQSELYKSFKVDLGLLGAIPSGDAGFGIGGYIEPKYNLTDKISPGFKLEGTAIGEADLDGTSTVSASASSIVTIALTTDYYFTTAKVRPFGGLGLGYYLIGGSSVNVNGGATGVSVTAGNRFGFFPRAGVEIGHFRIGLEYNIVTGSDQVEIAAGFPTVEVEDSNRNYFSIKLGGVIGGGKR